MAYTSEANKAFLDFMCDTLSGKIRPPYHSMRHASHAYSHSDMVPPDRRANQTSDGHWTEDHFTQMRQIKLSDINLDEPVESKEDPAIYFLNDNNNHSIPFSARMPATLVELKKIKERNPETTLYDAILAINLEKWISPEYINNTSLRLYNDVWDKNKWEPFDIFTQTPTYQSGWTNLYKAADKFLEQLESDADKIEIHTLAEKHKISGGYGLVTEILEMRMPSDDLFIDAARAHRKTLEKMLAYPAFCTEHNFLIILTASPQKKVELENKVDQIINDLIGPLAYRIQTNQEEIFRQYQADIDWIVEKSIVDPDFAKVEKALRDLKTTDTFLVNEWIENAKVACTAMRDWLEIKKQKYGVADLDSLKNHVEKTSFWKFWQKAHQDTKVTIMDMLPKLESLLDSIEAQSPRQVSLSEEKPEIEIPTPPLRSKL